MALSLEIVTPEQRVLSVQCDEVRLPGLEGGFGVRPRHTPLVAALAPGELVIVSEGKERRFAVGEGFAEISNDRVHVLVEEAIRAEELDAQAATKDLAEKTRKLQGLRREDPEYAQARARVERAAARALVASKQ